MNSPANYSNRPLQDTEFDLPSLDRKGHPIDYHPPCPASRMGSTAHPLKKANENSCCLYNCNVSIFKTQGGPRDILENRYLEKTS